MDKERVSYLFKVYQQQTASKQEQEEFISLLQEHHHDEVFCEILDQQWDGITDDELQKAVFPKATLLLQSIKQQIAPRPKLKKLWLTIAAAAILLTILSVSLIFWYNKAEEIHYAGDIAPGKNGATLTLANGRKISINDALSGDIASEDGVKISKNKDGQIIYSIDKGNSEAVSFNTITTTRGEQIQVRLPDHTLVYLNAESSLKFPTSFANNTKRTVMLEGEGYFEVSKDKQHPFVVKNKTQEIEVLGTIFNINAYADEPNLKTTLLEGSVRVTNLVTNANALLVPGQQAIVDSKTLQTKTVETDDIVAWKNGYFMFNNETLFNILRKVSKWYDMEVIYKDDSIKSKTFFGSISKYGNISELLKVLQKTDVTTFEIKGKQVIVSAKE